ncbi:MAG: extradiol dioxygenase [Candidatus Amoebophilus sp. 36-38]|nr:MAG: extradiol dioxygenase [Candidatus Amoebophilus sp. 36-38]
MAKNVFINLPVKKLVQSEKFFNQLGFTINPQFSDDKAKCLVIGDNIFAMLLTEEFFQDFTNKAISNAQKSTEVLIGIDASSKEEVKEMVKKAEKAGGTIYAESRDYGWMYQHSFADLDGHQWVVTYMDISKMPKG